MKSCKKGLTLSELLLALMILAFTLTGLLALFINCIFLNESNRNLTIAISHAQFALEDLKNTTFASIASATWDSATISAKGLVPLNNEFISINVSGTTSLDIQVIANWKDRGVIDRNIVFQTLMVEP